MEVLRISGELLLGVVGNKTDPLQLAVATDRQGLWLAGDARVRRGTIAAQVCTLPSSQPYRRAKAAERHPEWCVAVGGGCCRW
jgi:hypothetical protein